MVKVKLIWRAGYLLILCLLSACEISCNISAAKLSDAVAAAGVNHETQAPVDIRDKFAPDIPKVYVTVKVSHAPPTTKVKALFYYIEQGVQQVAELEQEVSGTRYVSFELSPPASGWPLGKYETHLLLNGEEKSRVQFSVAEEAQLLGKQSAADTAKPEAVAASALKEISYKRVAEANFGFHFEMPSNWTWELTPQKDYLISGPAGSDAFEIALRIQVIAKQAGVSGSLQTQFEDAQRQLAAVPGSALQKKGLAKIAGVEAPFFIVKYTTKDSQGAQTEFAHSQLVLEAREYYLWISYSAPVQIYTSYLPVFQHLVDTFGFEDS